MKTRVFLAILLLTVVAILYCSDDPSENAEYQRKTRELKALSERFKAETGFEGTIEYDYDNMKLSSFRGGFTDIAFPATQDTTIIRQSFERVVDKMLPYISATRAQLKKSSMFSNLWGIGTRYQQFVNGYPIEGGGYMNVSYTPKQNRIDILNDIVDIKQVAILNTISEAAAFKIARTAFEQTEYCNELTPTWRSKTVIQYKSRQVNGKAQPYRLCWRVTFPGLSYYIDAETSEWFHEGYVINDL